MSPKRKRVKRVFFLIMIAASVAMIWFFSSDNGKRSSGKSHEVAIVCAKVLYRDFDALAETAREEIVDQLHYPIRKMGHMAEFANLGIWCALFASTLPIRRHLGMAGVALGICLLVAVMDETHQLFVPGRGSSAIDVCIDMVGAGVGTLVVIWAQRHAARLT